MSAADTLSFPKCYLPSLPIQHTVQDTTCSLAFRLTSSSWYSATRSNCVLMALLSKWHELSVRAKLETAVVIWQVVVCITSVICYGKLCLVFLFILFISVFVDVCTFKEQFLKHLEKIRIFKFGCYMFVEWVCLGCDAGSNTLSSWRTSKHLAIWSPAWQRAEHARNSPNSLYYKLKVHFTVRKNIGKLAMTYCMFPLTV